MQQAEVLDFGQEDAPGGEGCCYPFDYRVPVAHQSTALRHYENLATTVEIVLVGLARIMQQCRQQKHIDGDALTSFRQPVA